MANTRDYINAENNLQNINRKIIALSDEDIKRYNVHFHRVEKFLIEKMKQTDQLFNELYTNQTVYEGSFFNGLKVSKPDEFDINLCIKFPSPVTKQLWTDSTHPGFNQIKILDFEQLHDQKWNTCKSWLDSELFLKTDSIRSWFQSIIQRTFNQYIRNTYNVRIDGELYNLKYSEHGPAGPAYMIKVEHYRVSFDIDIVPVIEINESWPNASYRQQSKLPNEAKNLPWYLVPKSPKSGREINLQWRTSFCRQERELIKDTGSIKPVIRLMKKFRDTQYLKEIASYYITTMFLWETEKQPAGFWNYPLSYLFVFMLKKFEEYVKIGKIPYFWNDQNNLIESMNYQRKNNISMQLHNIIADIDQNVNINGNVISKYIDN